jgi:hypothetical protein
MELNGHFHAPAVLLTWTNPSYTLAERLGRPQSWSGRSGKITFTHIGNRNPSWVVTAVQHSGHYTYRQFNIQ